jgi:hypothetical protein
MNASRSPYHHTDAQQLLQETLKHLADAREFYLHASRSVVDREIRNAFGYSAEAHAALLESLNQVLPAAARDAAAPEPSVFAAVAGRFDGRTPQRSAQDLHALDANLLQRMEALFANYPDMRVRGVLKRHVQAIQRAGDATRRLALRNVA